MNRRSISVILIGLFCSAMIVAQPGEHPDMTAYRARNGGIPGWNSRDGLGPAVNVHSTGATIGGGGGFHTHIAGWNSQDGLGPVVTHHNNNNNWGNGNSGTNWGNGGNNNINPAPWGGNTHINTNSPHWHASGWGNPGWGGGLSSSWNNAWNSPLWSGSGGNVIVNNYYNSNYWWRDLRNPPPGSPIAWGGNSYYYHDGNFFSILNGIYQVVLPVLGLILQALPSGAIKVDNYNNYYSYHGVFYYNTGNGYRVVPPPVGACLPSLPYFAKAVTVGGVSCYKYDNVYIEPVYNNYDGAYCYRVMNSVY